VKIRPAAIYVLKRSKSWRSKPAIPAMLVEATHRGAALVAELLMGEASPGWHGPSRARNRARQGLAGPG